MYNERLTHRLVLDRVHIQLFLAISAMIGGLVMLACGADRMIVGATRLARRLHISEAVIGATVVASGTSLPELMASLQAAFSHQYGLAVGNVIGSNIINIALGIGLVSIIKPIHISATIARRDWPLLMMSTALLCIIGFYLHVISLFMSLAFLLVWIIYIMWSIQAGQTTSSQTQTSSLAHSDSSTTKPSIIIAIMWFVLGSVVLALGGSLLVWGAIYVAEIMGVSDAMIGLTVVTIGTSAPDIAHSLLAIHRNKHQLAIGNILGSNVFNIFLILGITGLFGTLPIVEEIRYRDLWWMLGFTLILPVAWRFGKFHINRTSGFILVACYGIYLTFLLRSLFT